MDCRDFSTPVDEEGRGQCIDAPIRVGCAVVADHYTVIHPQVRQERLHYFPALIVHGHTENLEPLVLVLTLHVHEPGDFDFARPAPSRPEVQQNDLSLVIRKVHHLAIGVFQAEIRGILSVFVGLHRRGHHRILSVPARPVAVAPEASAGQRKKCHECVSPGHVPNLNYIDNLVAAMVFRNQSRRRRPKRARRVNSSWSSTPEYSQAAVSQKLSQQYSRHRRLRNRISRAVNSDFRHSADQPSSPRAPVRYSCWSRSSKAWRAGFPARSQTKWKSSCTKTRGNSRHVQLSAMRLFRKNVPPWTAPCRSRSPGADSIRTGVPEIGGNRRNSASTRFSGKEP